MTRKIKRQQRYDRYTISTRPTRTPQGFLRVPAKLTRVGVLKYRKADGTTFRELRLPDEVFSEESMSTLGGAPLTVNHHGMIGPENVTKHAVGYVSEKVVNRDRFVEADIIVQERETIDAVIAKELVELSPGYTCDVEHKKGLWQGEQYDGIQRNILYNHLAIGPKDWGRSGNEVKVHLDGDENTFAIADSAARHSEEPITKKKEDGANTMKKSIILNGIPFEVEVADNLSSTIDASIQKMDSDKKGISDERDKLQGKLDAAEKENKELKEKIDSDEEIERRVESLVKLREDARKLKESIKFGGKSAKELKIEALKEVGYEESKFDGKNESYIDGIFDSEVTRVDSTKKKKGTTGVGAPVIPRTKADSGDEKDEKIDAQKARQKMIEKNHSLWMDK